jgi:uncharacterized protein YggT (Ycf19 family)
MISNSTLINALLGTMISSALTLYMLAILVRWVGPWIDLDFHPLPWRIIPKLVDPLLSRIRKVLPAMGPMDWSAPAALMGVWLIRLLLVRH